MTDPLRVLGRWLVIVLAILTLAGQVHEAERAAQIPALSMSIRDARVVAVTPGGNADAAGVEVGDVIARVNESPVPRFGRAAPLLLRAPAGQTLRLQLVRRGQTRDLTLALPAPTGFDVLWRLALAAVGILTLLVGLLVFLEKPRGLTLLFAGICYGMSSLLHPPYVPPFAWAELLSELMLDALTFLTPALFVHLFLLFPLRSAWGQWPLPWRLALYAPSLVLGGSAMALRLSAPSGPAGHIWSQMLQFTAALFWVVGIGAAIALFIRSYGRARTETARRQVRLILWGTILGTLPIAMMTLWHQLQPGLDLPAGRLAVIFTICIPLSFAYAIVRHGVLDASVLVRRGLALSAMSAILVLTYFGASLLLRTVLPSASGGPRPWFSFIGLLAAALLSFPAQRAFRRFAERTLGSDRGPERAVLYEFGQAIRGELRREPLVRAITDCLAGAIGAHQLACFEPTPDGGLQACYLYGVSPAQMRAYRLSPALTRRLGTLSRPVDRGEFETDLPFGYIAPADLETLDAFGTALLVPLRVAGALSALVLVGKLTLDEPLTTEGLRLAATIASEGSIALENARLHEQSLEEQELRDEVDVARDVQQRLLPTHMPQVESLELSGLTVPCRGVGGDYYDCFRTPWGEIVLAIGDASGKGVPAALLMANLQALVHTEGRRNEPPAKTVERINARLCEMRKPEHYVTFCLARIDPLTGRLTYSNAGHPGMLLARANDSLEELTRGGLPLGIRPQASYDGGESTLLAGDLLVLYTDGITERRDGDAEFGRERLHRLVRQERRQSARALQETILAAVREFAPGPLEDDTTLLLVKVL